MLDQGAITPADYRAGIKESIPVVTPPFDDSKAPYFTTWVRQQMVDRYGAERAFKGGLRVRTTLDLNLQDAAQQAVNNYLTDPNGPTASIVAIDNETGAVRAMVGGRATNGQEFARTPFNLATQGQRQPGSAFKPFVLAAALRKGISPSSTWTSKRKQFDVPGTGGKEKFVVNNYEGNYSGVTTLAGATVTSDNSVYAEVGFRTGFRRIARMARDMGIRSPVSTNPAITLGGLKQGVSVLDMAHAYETLAQRGLRVEGSLGASGGGPVGIRDVSRPSGTDADGNPKYSVINRNETHKERIFSRQLADVEVPILGSVVTSGTGKRAAIPGTFVAGKTGTTENYGDAWFVGFTDKLTVAVWVGYPNEVRPMKTEFRGQPVAGGTFPAMIWRDFMASAIKYFADREAAKRAKEGLPPTGTTTVPPATEPPATTTATAPTGATSTPAAAPQTTPRTTPAPPPTPTTPAAPAPGTPAPTAPPPAQGQPTTGAGTGGAGAGSP
jgi:penicillin-binding protein 1A